MGKRRGGTIQEPALQTADVRAWEQARQQRDINGGMVRLRHGMEMPRLTVTLGGQETTGRVQLVGHLAQGTAAEPGSAEEHKATSVGSGCRHPATPAALRRLCEASFSARLGLPGQAGVFTCSDIY